MASIVLKSLSNPTQISDTNIFDTTRPLNYYQWIQQNIAIIPDQAEQQYQKYLLDWYSNKNEVISLSTNQNKIKEDYISLLKRVSVLFKDDPEFERFTKINFDSPTELRLAIPFYARKLKEIALYFASKREDLKKSKVQYNLVGSSNALEKILYEQLLKAFTQNTAHISRQEVYSKVPELSAVSSDFSIEVEELWDMENYFDNNQNYALSSTNPLIFVLEDYIANFYNVLDISEVPLSALSNPLSRFILCENEEELNEQIVAQYGEKLLGNSVYQLTGGYYTPDIKPIEMDLQQGNNYFYWFGAEYTREIPEGTYVDLPISAIDWTRATGASSSDISDILWVNVGNISLKGAWLMDSDYQTINKTMTATMSDGRYFKFPYPGYGTSAENISWTGPQITDIIEPSRKFFPSESSFLANQEKIKDLYWSNYSTVSSITPILLQNTTLKDVAQASNNYKQADKLIVRRNVGDDSIHDQNPNNVFQGDLEESWLFDFKQTEISVKAGTNNIYYPLTAFQTSDDLSFIYDSGDTISLSAINIGAFAGAVAGSNLKDSDVLIKLNSVCGPEMEAAFLRGIPLSSYNGDRDSCACDGDYTDYYTGWKYKNGVTQPSLSFKTSPGEFTRFVWTGPKININEVFQGFVHDQACDYYKEKSHPSILDTNFLNKSKKDVYEQWKKCSCKAVNYSPLGHNGPTIDHYRVIPDFIAKDTTFPSNFSFNTWRGSDNQNYKSSKDLAWFRTTNQLEADVGWSSGEWLSNTDDPFYLETGKTYWYWRSDINRCGFDLPYLIVNKCYQECTIPDCNQTPCIPVWTKAVQNDDGNWVETTDISDMTMESGKFYSYKHQNVLNFSNTRLLHNGQYVTSAEYISLSAVDPSITYKDVETNIPAIDFLIKIQLDNAVPYWGKSYTEYNLNKHDFRQLGDLQIIQPIPSDTLLSNNDVLEYKSRCGNCFVWEQPITFSIQEPTRRWNQILVNDCVKSDILNHLHTACNNRCNTNTDACYSDCQEIDICGCADTCYNTKTGITATNIPSDILFNTELSGIPMFVNYQARNAYTLNFDVQDITDGGIFVLPVSTLFSDAQTPWKNLSNDWKPFVALEQGSELYTSEQRGLFTSDKLGTGKWELRNGKYELSTTGRSASSTDLIRSEYDLSVVSTDSTWMKNGSLINVNKNQTYYPYTNNLNSTIGLNESYILDYDSLSANERGQKLINCGADAYYNNLPFLTGNVINWQQDIWGNEYFLINDDSKTRLENKSVYSQLYIKTIDGEIHRM